jgi:uncharacterized protein YqfA (UPF0365 family)
VYTRWPALAGACRAVHRLLGVGAYVGAFLSLLGVTSLVLLRRLAVLDSLDRWQRWPSYLAVSCAISLGSLPGMRLWLVLLARKVAKLASASISR